MKLLLHTCCAPCLIYPLEQLKQKGFEITGFFYNPNIQPFAEYAKRRQGVEDFIKTAGTKVIYPQYNSQEHLEAIKGKEAAPERCRLCWSLRLRKTAKSAKENGFNYFSTTLLVSPHQDQAMLKKIGEDISKEEGIDFYYADFRPGYRKAHEQARALGIYCQKYCGCFYSQKEQCKKSGKP